MREYAVLIAHVCITPCAVFGGLYSDVVDIFNVISGKWSTAALSIGRDFLAATSLPNHGVAFFAGGYSASNYFDFRCRSLHGFVRGDV
jgi:hypothetical protein